MIKMYVMKTCPYCEYVERQVAADAALQKKFEVIDISTHISKMHEFMALRDNSPVFDEAKRVGDVGVPCYVLEDGTITLSSKEVGLKPMPEPGEGASCRLDGSGC